MVRLLCCALILCWICPKVRGGDCGAWTGNDPKMLSTYEDSIADSGVQNRLTSYSTSCTCGIITSWSFYARKNGTVIFYVLDGTTVRGTTSIHVPPLALDNFFEVPLSSDMWVSIRNGWYLGYFSNTPMITYDNGGHTAVRATGKTLTSVGSSLDTSSEETPHTNRNYAVQAYIEEGHLPMFLNMPYFTSIYTHTTFGTVVHTVSVTDLDPGDIPNLSLSMVSTTSGSFSFDSSTRAITYISPGVSQGQYEVVISVSDGCHDAVSGTATFSVVNEGPRFTNLPDSITILEAQINQQTLLAVGTTDPSGDTVTCTISSVNPASGTSIFSMTGNNLIQNPNPGFVYETAMYYDIRIGCSDGDNTIYSNFQVDIVKNEPPAYTANAAGYLPSFISRDRTHPQIIFTARATDPEGDTMTYSRQSCQQDPCSLTVSPQGEVSTSAELSFDGYDLNIRVTDSKGNYIDRWLSILVSENTPKTFNDPPVFVNLDATKYVMENTAVGTYLYRVMVKDQNSADTLTLSSLTSTGMFNTYFFFDVTTGVISVKASFNYESGDPTTMTLTVAVSDGTDTANAMFTVIFVDVNELPQLNVGNTGPLTIDEGPKDTVFPSAGLTFSDPDASDANPTTWDLNCGTETKYYYIGTGNSPDIFLAREYDMDSGLSGSAVCTVTVYDSGRLSATGTVTLSVTNVNDHSPRFKENHYTFLVSTSTAFLSLVANLTATDYDSNSFGSENGVITYSLDPSSAGNYFQINDIGLLYVRDVTGFAKGAMYTFKVLATDSDSRTGTCTITIVFPEVEIVTGTTTERSFTFEDDYLNYIWLFLVAICVVMLIASITLMVWFDPVVHDYVIFKMFRLSELCRKTPVEPRRSVGKLTVTINNKKLENDPDNALPWELLAKDADVPETHEVRALIEKRQEKDDREYLDFRGLPVFERGKGARPESPLRATIAQNSRQQSPKYATLGGASGIDNWTGEADSPVNDDDGNHSQWGNVHERVVYNAGTSRQELATVREVSGDEDTPTPRNTLDDF